MIDTIKYRINLDMDYEKSIVETNTGNAFIVSHSIFYHLINKLNILDGKNIIQSTDVPTTDKKKLYTIISSDITKNAFLLSKNIQVNLPSWSEKINIRYEPNYKTIDIEFSMPKYFFGNNVMELFCLPPSKYYKKTLSYHDNSNYLIILIKSTIKKIIFELTEGLLNINENHYSCIEIVRLDLCFNQFHDSKDDALNYLDALKSVKPSRLMDSKPSIYATSINFVTENYSYKVYHKGSEFSSIQRNQIINSFNSIQKKNKNNIPNKYILSLNNLDNLQSYSDKILRYEMRQGIKQFTYLIRYNQYNEGLYKNITKSLHKIFEPIPFKINGNIHILNITEVSQLFYFMFTDGKNIFKNRLSNNNKRLLFSKNIQLSLDDKYNKKIENFLETYLYLLESFNISTLHQLRKIWNLYNENKSKNVKVFLSNNNINKLNYTPYQFFTSEQKSNFEFNNDFLKMIMDKFYKRFNEYQLEKMPTTNILVKEAKKINTLRESKKMNVNRIKLISHFLKNGHIKELKERNLVSSATYYRIKKDIQLLTGRNNVNFIEQNNNCKKSLDNITDIFLKRQIFEYKFLTNFISLIKL